MNKAWFELQATDWIAFFWGVVFINAVRLVSIGRSIIQNSTKKKMEQQKEKKRKPHANRRLEETQKKTKKKRKQTNKTTDAVKVGR